MSADLPIFVYGTLLSWAPQGGLLGGLGRRRATTVGTLHRLPAGYPTLTQGGTGRVHGELVDPPSERVLALLDLYEGVDEGHYERRVIEVHVGLRTERAWAYVATSDPLRRGGVLIPSGEWRR